MNGLWRPVGAAVSAVGMLVLGLSASAPSAQAATVTIQGSVNSPSGPCVSGYADLYLWVVDATYDAGGYWSEYDEAYVSSGAYSLSTSSYVGRTATVRAYCDDSDTHSVYYGGSLVQPGSPNASNSKVLIDGTNDFGTLLTPQNVEIAGTVTQVDGSTLPVWDKNGALLPADSTQRSQYARYGISAWIEFYMPGADIATADEVSYCSAGYTGAFSYCDVPVGTYDVRVYASGFDYRATPSFNYPQTVALTRNYAVTATSGSALLSFKTASGPAAVVTSAPKVGGTAKVGNTVTAVPGVWNNLGFSATDPTFSYQWLVNGAAVSTAENYAIQPSDANKSLVLRVTVSRPLFDSATAESAAVLVAAPDDTRIAPTATAKFGTLKHGKKATVKVVVKAGGMGALGKIVVAEGSKTLGSKTLVAKNNGTVTVTFSVPKTKGAHTITVTYLGNAQVKGIVITKAVKVK